MYQNAEKQITQFVDEAAQLAPSTKEVRKYCSYSSEKFSRGSLGCTIKGTIQYSQQDEKKAKETLSLLYSRRRSLDWKFEFDNTKNNQKLYPDVIAVLVYKYRSLNCILDYEYAG